MFMGTDTADEQYHHPCEPKDENIFTNSAMTLTNCQSDQVNFTNTCVDGKKSCHGVKQESNGVSNVNGIGLSGITCGCEQSFVDVVDTDTLVMKNNLKTTTSELKLGCLNIRSLVNKIDQLAVFIKTQNFDILALNETWLDKSVTDNEIKIEGYNIIRNDRNRTGGGVCFYIKNIIKFAEESKIKTGIESLWLKLKNGNADLVIGTIYRPPNAGDQYFDNMLDEIQNFCTVSEYVIILGDLNINYTLTEHPSHNSIKTIECLFDLTQLVSSPTRVTINSSSLIDIILTSKQCHHYDTNVIKVSISDHYCVSTYYKTVCNIQEHVQDHKTITYRDYKGFNANNFIYDLVNNEAITEVNIEPLNMEQRWLKFQNAFLSICNKHAPLRTQRLKDRFNPWMTREIINLIYERDHIKSQAIKNKSYDLWNQYTYIRNKITNMIRETKLHYYNNEIGKCQGNSKKVWKIVNKITNKSKKPELPQQLNATVLNEYFSTIGNKVAAQVTKETDNIPWRSLKARTNFSFNAIEEIEIKKAIRNLGSDSNTDVLGFDSKLLVIACEVIAPLICKLVNLSLATAVIPSDWKIARVTPIYKGEGDKYEKTNYRPISVIGHISKIMEIQVHKQLICYMQNNNYINIDQSAYLKHHNTQTALHRVTDDWIDNICNGLFTAVCALDIKKCFDTIDHNILLTKLEYYGIINNEIQWFQSYLSNRQQIVRCNGKVSDVMSINIGVPQGSVLGPILFLIMVNDISQHVHTGTANLYADDTLIYCEGNSVKEVNDRLQECINSVSDWYNGNNIILNASKSNTMLIASRFKLNKNTESLKITLNNQILPMVSDFKYLGIEIDSNLHWTKHVNKLCKVLGYKLSQLSRLRNNVPSDILRKIYNSGIQPIIDYALTVWGTTINVNINRVQRLQNYAARIISRNFDYINTRGIDLVKFLGWMSVKQRFLYFQILLMFKCIHGHAPVYLLNNITLESEISNVNTRRHPLDLYIPIPVNEFHKKILFYRGAKAWNNLPGEIRNITNFNAFKNKLKHFIKQN